MLNNLPPKNRYEEPPPMMIDDGNGHEVPNPKWDYWHGGVMYACRALSRVIDAMGYRCTRRLEEIVEEKCQEFKEVSRNGTH